MAVAGSMGQLDQCNRGNAFVAGLPHDRRVGDEIRLYIDKMIRITELFPERRTFMNEFKMGLLLISPTVSVL